MKVSNRIDFESILDSKTYNLIFYKRYSAELINFLKNNGPCTFANLIAHLGGGERRVVRLVDQMIEQKLIFFREGEFYVPESNKTYSIEKLRCPHCDSKLINTDELSELRLFMEHIINNRPSVDLGYDQRPVNVDTIIRRVGYMIMRSDIQGKRVAIIGDDDLNSIAIALTQLPQEIVVFDIDSRVLNYINAISKKHRLKIKTIKLNLLNKISKEYQDYFDTFITDPTPNLKPLYLFTLRGMQMLGGIESKFILKDRKLILQ